jgi:hypothetical protein
MGILSSLFADPTQPGGGWLFRLLDPQASTAISTATPLTTVPNPGAPNGNAPGSAASGSSSSAAASGAQPAAASALSPRPPGILGSVLPPDVLNFFRPHTGILGNSAFGSAVRGGLNGLANSTGFTGMAAVGQGFAGGTQGEQEHQFAQIRPLLLGQQYQQGQQQYQQGQQQLVSGNIANIFALNKVNALRRSLDKNAPPLSMADLNADPSIVNSPTGGLQQGGQPGAQGPLGPQGPQMVGMQPVYGGGQGGPVGVNPQVNAAYGPIQGNGTAPGSWPAPINGPNPMNSPNAPLAPGMSVSSPASGAPQAASQQTDPQQQAATNPFQDEFDQIAVERQYDPALADNHLKALQSSPDYITWKDTTDAQIAAANANVQARGTGPMVQYIGGVPHVTVAPSLDTSGATGIDVYNTDGSVKQHVTTGLPTGVPEAYKAAVDRNNEVQDLYSGSASVERQNTLQRMGELANGPTQYGPGQQSVAYWKALAAAVPGLHLITDKFGSNVDESNMEVFKKYMSTLGAQYQAALGGRGTDANLENSLNRVPGPDKLNSAIKELVPYLQSLEAAGQGNVNARAKWVADHGGMPGGKTYMDFEQTWRKAYDPRVYQYEQAAAAGQGSQWIKENLKPNELKTFEAKIAALTRLGAVQ